MTRSPNRVRSDISAVRGDVGDKQLVPESWHHEMKNSFAQAPPDRQFGHSGWNVK